MTGFLHSPDGAPKGRLPSDFTNAALSTLRDIDVPIEETLSPVYAIVARQPLGSQLVRRYRAMLRVQATSMPQPLQQVGAGDQRLSPPAGRAGGEGGQPRSLGQVTRRLRPSGELQLQGGQTVLQRVVGGG